jgi:uncharacterized membrane protein YidH (DUF202 family)
VSNGASARQPLVEDEELAGLAGERTDLAWTRSGLAVLAAGAALLRRVVHGFDLESVTAIVFAIVTALVAVAIASFVYSTVFAAPTRHPNRPAGSPARLQRVAYGTTAFGVLAMVIGLFPT